MAIRPLELTTGYTLHSQSGQPQASLPKGLWEPWLALSVPCAQLWGTGTSQPQPLSAPGLSAIRSLHLCPDPTLLLPLLRAVLPGLHCEVGRGRYPTVLSGT